MSSDASEYLGILCMEEAPRAVDYCRYTASSSTKRNLKAIADNLLNQNFNPVRLDQV
jgi:hypothetical protein